MTAHAEILNIDYHTCRLMVKALNKFRTKAAAAKAMGISERNLYRLKKRYGIKLVGEEYNAAHFSARTIRIIEKGK